MSRVQTLSQARGGWGPTLHQFEQIHKSKPDCLFCFFEGEDVKYYGFRIQENLPNMKWEGINCGGKAVVVKIYQLLKKHENVSYQQAKKTFFVDRDEVNKNYNSYIKFSICINSICSYTTMFAGLFRTFHDFA